jgi:hypothetical protein
MAGLAPLTNSTTSIPKATYVGLKIPAAADGTGGAVRKSSFVQSLDLAAGEVAAARAGAWPSTAGKAGTTAGATVAAAKTAQAGADAPAPAAAPEAATGVTPGPAEPAFDPEATAMYSTRAASPAPAVSSTSASTPSVWTPASTPSGDTTADTTALDELLVRFEGTPIPSQLPATSAFAHVSDSDLVSFGNALVTLRRNQVAAIPAADAQSAAAALNALNTALVSTNSFTTQGAVTPIGMLNLESLQMTPAGIERGGLLATIPLAPGERTEVVQQEWSVVTQEFTSIVTDELANFSQTGVTDNTQLTQSTTSQIAHSNQFNISASVSGGIGFVSGSVSTGFSTQDQSSQSAAVSRNDAQQATQTASSRATQSHKMTISTKTESGSSDATTRMLVNPSSTEPMRIDYFSLMRKWYVALYRYGLRLTYDVTVPEPGAAMREIYRELAELENQSAQGFVFDYAVTDITEQNYVELAKKYGAVVTPPPASTVQMSAWTGRPSTSPFQVTLDVPDGYWITKLLLVATLTPSSGDSMTFRILGSYYALYTGNPVSQNPADGGTPVDLTAPIDGYRFMYHATGAQSFTIEYDNIWKESTLSFIPFVERTDAAWSTWQTNAWQALYNAAQTTFYNQQQTLSSRISALQQQITSVDTLTLRREENDEIMKCVLRWLLGAKFEFMPQSVVKLFKDSGGDLKYGIDFTGDSSGLSAAQWRVLGNNEERISFINQAIDWDSTLYFAYSYFWDVPESWTFIRQIQHPDATRQAFLRAGSARVVLTVRQGWEVAWAYFVEYGYTTLPDKLPSHPTLTIAQQIESYDSTNYPGIPPPTPPGRSTRAPRRSAPPATSPCSRARPRCRSRSPTAPASWRAPPRSSTPTTRTCRRPNRSSTSRMPGTSSCSNCPMRTARRPTCPIRWCRPERRGC